MRAVVTGGMGFIGTSVVRRLQSMGHDVVIVDYIRHRLELYEVQGLPILREVYHNLRDCVDAQEPDEFLRGTGNADVYIHLGACVDTRGVQPDLFSKNVDFVRELTHQLPYQARVIYGSSAAVYGTEGFPCNPYGMTKSLGEKILASRSFCLTNLRFFNVYGRHEHHKGDMASVVSKIAHAYRTRGGFNMWSPDASRDFVSVSQVTDAVVGHALEKNGACVAGCFDVGTGVSTTFNDLDYALRTVFKRTESACRTVEMPPQYKGRYQTFTKAGHAASPISPYIKQGTDIRELLKEQFIDD